MSAWSLNGKQKYLHFRTPESESERNLTKLFHNCFITFLLRLFWKISFYDYRSNLFQIFEDNYETINNIWKSNYKSGKNYFLWCPIYRGGGGGPPQEILEFEVL